MARHTESTGLLDKGQTTYTARRTRTPAACPSRLRRHSAGTVQPATRAWGPWLTVPCHPGAERVGLGVKLTAPQADVEPAEAELTVVIADQELAETEAKEIVKGVFDCSDWRGRAETN